MCGIAGIVSNDHSLVSAERIKQMTNLLVHRGPDAEGHWILSPVALGSRRLAIIDLTVAGNQPMRYLDRYTIVHNGEIYNYIELKDELQKKGYQFFSKTDTEVIAAAYDTWREECLDRFDGMFAFAIWDQKEKELFAARDRFGEKPFFYFINKDQFVFASEMKALWAAGIEREVNLKLLFNYLTIGYVDNPNIPEETFFENISKLPAGAYLKLSPASTRDELKLSIYNYWDIDIENENKRITDNEAIDRFGQLFQRSVKRRLRSDVPIGVSLSGGLDSSSVIAVLHSLTAHLPGSHGTLPLTAFSAIFPKFEKDESVFARIVADKFHLDHFTVTPDTASLYTGLEELFYYQEEPFSSASIYAQFKVYELARQKGIKVLLDGQGADEILAGYHKYYKWYWQELFRKRKLSSSHELGSAKELGIPEKFTWKNRIAALFPEFATIVLERQYLINALKHEDLTKDFVQLQSKEAYYITPEIFSLNGVLYFNTLLHGLEELLRYADRNSMAHSREIRLPFLDHELVEFVFSLPSNFKIRNGWTKWLLRETMKDKLPLEITWRKDKTGFEPPQQEWLSNENIQELVINAKQRLISERILKPEVINKKIQAKAAYDADNFDWRYLSSSFLFT
ncbi:MAG TPA: asparagine synthase (glutamine-hydrolyzing) [Chitinophagaceae bacterium]|nr:asparagine synthase (glutamine-hydrolyzing) [Chitinophagaceae bacterium]